jgi:hypothetical protein
MTSGPVDGIRTLIKISASVCIDAPAPAVWEQLARLDTGRSVRTGCASLWTTLRTPGRVSANVATSDRSPPHSSLDVHCEATSIGSIRSNTMPLMARTVAIQSPMRT